MDLFWAFGLLEARLEIIGSLTQRSFVRVVPIAASLGCKSKDRAQINSILGSKRIKLQRGQQAALDQAIFNSALQATRTPRLQHGPTLPTERTEGMKQQRGGAMRRVWLTLLLVAALALCQPISGRAEVSLESDGVVGCVC